jgi:dTDP-4-amino-4,6-dideoxygalactose transaminase
MDKIVMVDLQSQYKRLKTEIDKAIEDVLKTANFIKGHQVSDFENNLAHFIKSKYCISCGNGTDALQIALMALNLKPGDEVIIPAFTYIATVEVAALLNLKIILVDVDENNFNLSVNSLGNLEISTKTKAIMPVHLYGQCAPMQTIMELAKSNNLYVVEDNAQAIGAEYIFNDNYRCFAGTIGDIGCTSFFPSKNLGAFGDGGAIFTQSKSLAEKISLIANHGQKIKYQHDTIGINSRLDTIQAAILNVKLNYLNEFNKKRQYVAEIYDRELNNYVIIPKKESYSTHVYHQYTIRLENKHTRDKLKNHLSNLGIPSVIYYPIPVHLQPGYSYLGYKKGDFKNAEKLSETVLSLPMHTEMNETQLSFIIEGIKSFFRN